MIIEKVSLKHKNLIETANIKDGIFNGDYCFGNVFAWGGVFDTKICIDDGLFSRMSTMKNDRMLISFPQGEGDKKAFIKELSSIAFKNGKTPFLGLCPEKVKINAEQLFENIAFKRVRENDDYVYSVEALTRLSGKDYHTKKNMLNSFLKNEYTYNEITPQTLQETKAFCMEKAFTKEEAFAMERFFDKFTELMLCGAYLKIKDKIVAATVAEKQGDTVIIHIEKAEKTVRGAYAAINNLFLKNSMDDILFVNREEDMGQENLRKAKLSYKPEFLVEKYIADLRGI